jgi:polyisoprenoid-binding protein YceI
MDASHQKRKRGTMRASLVARARVVKAGLVWAVLTGAVSLAGAQTSTWKIDMPHTEADFTIRHMAISNVRGRFGNVKGTITLDPNDVTKSSVEAIVDVTTVDTGVAQRDGDLRSPHFFEVEKFPIMTFASKSVTKSGDDYNVAGDLTMHGVTKAVTLHLEAPGKAAIGPDGREHRGFTATTTIRRQDFGLNWNGMLKSGDAMLGDDVKVTLDVEAIRQ